VDADAVVPFVCVVAAAPKPVVAAFAVTGPGVATLVASAAPVVVGSFATPCGFTVVGSPVLVATVPMVVAPGAAGPPFVGRDGGANAAAVDELAAMAAAAIASGAVASVALAAPVLVVAGGVATGMAVATAITVAAGVAAVSSCVTPVAPVVGVESATGLSVDLASLGFAVADLAPPDGLPLAPDFAAAGPVGAGLACADVPESAAAEGVEGVPCPELPAPGDVELLGAVEASLFVVRCGACGSEAGAGAGVLVGSAGEALSTSAAKLLLAGAGSGRAGFGGAA
jgi:hypothetical protein